MSVTIIFAVGLVVFILFLLGIFLNNKEAKNNPRSKIETDTVDYDGSGNFGRIPNKKPKNRAIWPPNTIIGLLNFSIIGTFMVLQSILNAAFAQSSIDVMFKVGEESGQLAILF